MKQKYWVYKHEQFAPQYGGALVYILLAVVMVGVLTATLLQPGGQGARAKKSIDLAQQLDIQIQFIKSAIQECVIMYPAGDPTINDGPTTDPNYTAPYPVLPISLHFFGSTLGIAADITAEFLRCPGNPGIDNNHTPIFGPTAGRFFPKTPLYGHDWFYLNRSTTYGGRAVEGVLIVFAPFDTNDDYVRDAFARLDAKYNDCELEVILDGDDTNGCVSGRDCLIYWLVRKAPAC